MSAVSFVLPYIKYGILQLHVSNVRGEAIPELSCPACQRVVEVHYKKELGLVLCALYPSSVPSEAEC